MAEESAAHEGYRPFPSFSAWQSRVEHSEAFEQFEALYVAARQSASQEALNESLRQLLNRAAVDTGAIEGLYAVERGFTVTVAAEAAVVEAMTEAKGADAAGHLESALRAYGYVLDLATGREPMSEAWIRGLHEVVCAHQEFFEVLTSVGPQQQELTKGAYKTRPNNPSRREGELAHVYAPVDEVAPEMARLVAELRSDSFLAADPVTQAAYAHYAFVSVHPFPDGNGRMARALASVFTYRRPGVPLVIYADERGRYFDALMAADEGNFQVFQSFMSERIIEAIEEVRDFVVSGSQLGEAPEDVAARFRKALAAGIGGLTHPEADAIAHKLIDVAASELDAVIAAYPNVPGVNLSRGLMQGPMAPVPSGFRGIVANPRSVSLAVGSAPPASASAQALAGAFISLPGSNAYHFKLVATLDGQPHSELGLRLAEVDPEVSESARRRLRHWGERLVTSAFARAADGASAALRNQGFAGS
jgi:Fic family protein